MKRRQRSARRPPQPQTQTAIARPTPAWFSSAWPWLVLLAGLCLSLFVRLRMLELPLERDEGEYAYIAQQMLDGVPPFESAYSIKLPGVAAVYAAAFLVAGQTVTAIHAALLVVSAVTTIVLFLFVRRLFGPAEAALSAVFFTVLSLGSGVQGLTAQTEHFATLPATAALLVLDVAMLRRRMALVFVAGLLAGIAVLMKQPSATFGILAAAWLVARRWSGMPRPWRGLTVELAVLSAGALLPLAVTCLVIWQCGVFEPFWFWIVEYPRLYGSAYTPALFFKYLPAKLDIALHLSWPIWVLAALGLPGILLDGSRRPQRWFALGWLAASAAAVLAGWHLRNHYFIYALPCVAALAAAGAVDLGRLLSRVGLSPALATTAVAAAVLIGPMAGDAEVWFRHTPQYASRVLYHGNPCLESQEIARYLREHSNPTDTIAVLGSEPQICFYAHRRSAAKFIYVYPLMELHSQAKSLQQSMVRQVEQARPPWLVLVNVSTSWLQSPRSERYLLQWAGDYIDRHYQTVGLVELPGEGRASVFHWGEAADRLASKGRWILIARRKDEA